MDYETFEIFLPFIIFAVLIILGLLIGGYNERRHLRRIRQREQEMREMVVTQTKNYPLRSGTAPPCFVVEEVVIATDYLKSFLASLRNIFGGEVKSYQTLLERARREATLRIMEQARELGYNAVCNVRLQTADVGGSTASRKVAMAAILASGTAYHAEV